jgi:hypothetical protein
MSVSEGGEPGTRLGCRHTNAECPLWASPTRKQAVAKPPMVAVQSSVAYVRYQEARQIDAMTVTGAKRSLTAHYLSCRLHPQFKLRHLEAGADGPTRPTATAPMRRAGMNHPKDIKGQRLPRAAAQTRRSSAHPPRWRFADRRRPSRSRRPARARSRVPATAPSC